ncbi:rho guanine nucleotide exchange factor TIAM2 [Nothobranchius furzeri]|uniref:T-cell lymphoma invasion and metastasis 2 n=5 Tax=Nothobranchius TaxID=28779 RepID=A0A1A8B561_NOTFU|nr:T-lymphoma invasion and metastasis-inducing protein 2-like [Nothobranchius furzeri]
MGNTDSHSTFASPVKPSFRFSKREEAPSARTWWKSNTRSRGRGYPSQNASWHYETKPAQGGAGSPQKDRVLVGSRRSDGGSVENGSSPKVLLSKDGSMRVAFTTSRMVPVEPTPPLGTGPETSLRTSNGSSLSSDGSWYDSPWGGGGELTDGGWSLDNSSGYNTFSSAQVEEMSPGLSSALLFPVKETVTGFNSCCSGRTEDSGIGDSVILQPDLGLVSESGFSSSRNALPAFPVESSCFPVTSDVFSAAFDICFQEQTATAAFSSSALTDIIQAEPIQHVERFPTSTLPCRRPQPMSSASCGVNRKDYLKSRIQRLSEWTGSLSRKRRRIQESPDVFISGLSGSMSWSSNPLHHQNQAPLVHCSSSRGQNQSNDVQRQNIYRNFMQELETGRSSVADRTDPSEGEEDDDEEEEVDEGGGDLEVLLEKEQGVVRRAGWLSFKPLISISRDQKLELVARRRWRRFWVTLKGCSLLFYETFGRSGADQERSPRYALLADDGIVQAVPEHPRREHVFCLSNMYGDVYLFQATSQTDLENWVTAIHSASAALLARREGREDTLRLLRGQNRSLLHKIDMDGKMKKMAELQLSVIKEQKNRRAVENQIQQWEQNLEKLNLDLFRTRCYLSSLQGSEQPNSKSLLAVASRASKSMLGRLGVFSVSSFHSLICSREDVTLKRRCWTLSGGSIRKRGLPSSLKALNRWIKHSDHQVCDANLSGSSNHVAPAACWPETVKREEVAPPAGRAPELQPKDQNSSVFLLHVGRPDSSQDFGFAVTGHVDGAGESHVFISEVDPFGPSAKEGLRAGDEVLAVNGSAVLELDLDLLQTLFTHQNLQLLLRRDKSLDPEEPTLVWPEPTDPWDLADLCCSQLTPTHLHTWTTDSPLIPDAAEAPPPAVDLTRTNRRTPEQNLDQDFSHYRTFPETRASDADVPKNPYYREPGAQPPSPAHLSVCQRLRKVIQELVDTEKSYVKDLVCLLDVYLTPLQRETFLSKDEMEALFGSLPEMLDFQRVFLQTLEERIAGCPNITSLETPDQFKKLLFSLGGSFLYYADHFKLYSGFCANHIKVQKVLEKAKTDGAFKHFLEARNPTNQHSSSLESYLIKPVQRVLKYPLLLRELVSLTNPDSPEHSHLTEALRAMEKVASHINEMQKIYEEYGCVFDQLVAEQSGADKQVTEISMGEFLVHSSVVWLNPLPSVRHLRKDPPLTLLVFKRAVVLIHRQNKVKKRLANSRSADLDPFGFRWLIPVSALQIRPTSGMGSEDPCVWELIHSRSEVEGRPETMFQLSTSCSETKAALLRVLNSLLRDRAPGGSLRRSNVSKTKMSSTWRRRQHRAHSDNQKTPPDQVEENGRTNGVLEETCSEPLLPSHASSSGAASGRRTRLCSLTSDLEAQLQRLNFTEERQEAPPHVEVEKQSWSLRRTPAGEALDLSSFLEKDFSIQSMASIINEDFFYDPVLGIQMPNQANGLTC